eukprot:3879027-Pleurochrysis_carterae.AAC.1
MGIESKGKREDSMRGDRRQSGAETLEWWGKGDIGRGEWLRKGGRVDIGGAERFAAGRVRGPAASATGHRVPDVARSYPAAAAPRRWLGPTHTHRKASAEVVRPASFGCADCVARGRGAPRLFSSRRVWLAAPRAGGRLLRARLRPRLPRLPIDQHDQPQGEDPVKDAPAVRADGRRRTQAARAHTHATHGTHGAHSACAKTLFMSRGAQVAARSSHAA